MAGPLPMPRNTKHQEKRNELGLVIVDRGSPLVTSFGVAHPDPHSSTRRLTSAAVVFSDVQGGGG